MQTCPGFFLKSLLEYPGNLLEICSVKSACLQHAVDEFIRWSQEWGMVLNETKTKVMLFGGSGGEVVNVMINGQPI